MFVKAVKEWDTLVGQNYGTLTRFGDRSTIRRMMECVKAEIEAEQRVQSSLGRSPDMLEDRADDVADDWQWSCRFIRRCEFALAALPDPRP